MADLNETQENLKSNISSTSLWDPIEELELKVTKANKEDYEEIVKLLTQYLTYPSNEQAELHMESDKLGTKDLRSEV